MKRLELNPTQVKGTWSRTYLVRIPGTVVVPGTSERQFWNRETYVKISKKGRRIRFNQDIIGVQSPVFHHHSILYI